jgi:hypothetical protein
MTGFRASGIERDRSSLHFDNALSPSVYRLLPIFSLKSKIFSSLIGALEDRSLDPQCLCLCISLRVTQDA